ncbi:MAG: polysaccharide biosynthesis/export family protein [Bacteroidota bacterium]
MSKFNSYGLRYTLVVLTALLVSCESMKHIQYLQGDVPLNATSKVEIPDHRVQKGDQLSIAVYSDNPAASAVFNGGAVVSRPTDASMMQTGASTGAPAGTVYEVDEQGQIVFPRIGRLSVEGLTREGIRQLLDAKLKDTLLTNPQYNIRFLNGRITVFGEVQRPGVYETNSMSTNIFEALTLAGDLTFYARRDNILIIREQHGKREFGRLDVTKPDIFTSPFYQLQQNDMVFVDARNSKVRGTDQGWLRNASLILSILTAASVLVNIIR